MEQIFIIFILIKLAITSIESYLEKLNRTYYENPNNQKDACEKLSITNESFQKTLAYTKDKYQFIWFSNWINLFIIITFIAFGGFTYVENISKSFIPNPSNSIYLGLTFFLILGLLSFLISLPLDFYSIFHIEEKHGFNKQSIKTYLLDQIKKIILSIILGGILLSLILWSMEQGTFWWIWAWILLSIFSLFTSWIYPTFLAPIFNKFKTIEDGELKDQIFSLAKKVKFKTSGIFIMNASIRSTHGNAYFTGILGEKRIVLFDSLVANLQPKEIVAVLAHELGHFKLNHVRWGLVRGILMSGLTFYLLSLCLPLTEFYTAFGFGGISNYGALVVFSMWFGVISFITTPIGSLISRKNEFAADHFATKHIDNPRDLSNALLKLRETNQSMPLSHPTYSSIYYSHPPLIERLKAMHKNEK